MFDEDVARLCGPDGKHNPDRAGYRHGTEAGSVTLGGRRVPVTRPRVRAAGGTGELHLTSYDLFSGTEVLGRLAMERMLAGLSSRRYGHGLEPAGRQVEQAASATSKSAVSRRFVAATETALAELMTRRLDGLDLVAFMVDGVHFGEHTCVVALGIDIDGVKHPLAVEEGSTENATVVTDLIAGLRDRGLDVTRPVLAVLDGAKALSSAVKAVFDKPLIQRCQQHKIRNVIDKLPDRLKQVTERRMRQAYHAESALKAEGELEQLARELGKTHPGAAASLREGMAETLTILRLEVPPTLARTLHSTNPVGSTPRTSSGGGTAPWRCAGAPPGCSKPGTSSAASTATCTCPGCAPRSTATSSKMSVAHATIENTRQPDGYWDRHRSSTERGTTSVSTRPGRLWPMAPR